MDTCPQGEPTAPDLAANQTVPGATESLSQVCEGGTGLHAALSGWLFVPETQIKFSDNHKGEDQRESETRELGWRGGASRRGRGRDRQQKQRRPALDLLVPPSPGPAVLPLLWFSDVPLQPSKKIHISGSAVEC